MSDNRHLQRIRRVARHPFGVFGGFALVFGVLIGLVSADQLLGAVRASSWPETAGIIRSSNVAGDVISVEIGRMNNYRDRERRVHVSYEYTVDGITRRGTEVALFRKIGRNVHEDSAAFRPGSTVTVFYNRANQSRAVLDRRVSPLSIMGALAAIAPTALGVWALRKTELG